MVERLEALSIPEPNSGCVLWLGFLHKKTGYGYLNVNGLPTLVHRLAYEAARGPIPEGLVLDHLCRVRSCLNPQHLEPVTYAENLRRGLYANGKPVATHFRCGHARAGNTLAWANRCAECNRAWMRAHPVRKVDGRSVRVSAAEASR